jgi:hypothetical protein
VPLSGVFLRRVPVNQRLKGARGGKGGRRSLPSRQAEQMPRTRHGALHGERRRKRLHGQQRGRKKMKDM